MKEKYYQTQGSYLKQWMDISPFSEIYNEIWKRNITKIMVPIKAVHEYFNVLYSGA